jgi:hypothetical protein
VYNVGREHYYAMGVPQNFNADNNAGIVYALADAMQISVDVFINGLIKYIKESEPIGISPMLPDALHSIFIQNIEFYDWDENWVELFSDLVLEVYDYNVIIFRVSNETIRVRYNMSPKILILQYEFPNGTEFYPIYKLDAIKYSKTGVIIQRTFERIKEIDKLIPQSAQNDLTYLQRIKDVTIVKLFINLSNKCYGVIAEDNTSEGQAYIPVIYSPLISRIPLEYKTFKRSEYKLSLLTTRVITSKLYGKTTETLWYDNKFIGYVHNDMNVYCNELSESELSNIDPKLASLPKNILEIDPEDVNIAIATNRAIPDDIYNLYSNGYYMQHLYKFIKIELLNLIDSEKIHFDTIRQMSVEQLMDTIPHEIGENVKTDSNIIISCSKSNLKHCSSGKLIVPPNFREYCEILYQEIHNPVIDFVESQRFIVIDYLNFEKAQGEKIFINISTDE